MNEGDDPVADALVNGSVYERVRVRRISTFTRPIPEKLHRLGALSSLLAALAFHLAAILLAGQ